MSLQLVSGLWVLLLPALLFLIAHAIPLTHDNLDAFFSSELTTPELRKMGICNMAVAIVSLNDFPNDPYFWSASCEYDHPISDSSIFGIASLTKSFIAITSLNVFSDSLLAAKTNKTASLALTDLVPNLFEGTTLSRRLSRISEASSAFFFSQSGPRPKTVVPTRDISLIDLVTHTSGLDTTLYLMNDPYSRDLLLDMEHNLPRRIRQPGVVSAYSNFGFGLLGLAIERKLGCRACLGDILREYTFEPIGIRSRPDRENRIEVYTHYDEARLDANFVRRMIWNADRGESELYLPNLSMNISSAPAGCIYASASAMQKWMEALLRRDHRLMSSDNDELWDLLYTQQFAVGDLPGVNFVLIDLPTLGVHWYGHDGGQSPFESRMALSPEHGIGVFIVKTAAGGLSARNSILTKFTARFLLKNDGVDWCEEKGGRILKNENETFGHCIKTYNEIEKIWSPKERPEFERMIGCYIMFRFPHFHWMRLPLQFAMLVFGQLHGFPVSFCVEYGEDGYLHMRHLLFGDDRDMVLLEKSAVDEGAPKNSFMIAEMVSPSQVTVDLTGLTGMNLPSAVAFTDLGGDDRYIVWAVSMFSCEFIRHPLLELISILLTPVIAGIAVATSLVVLTASFSIGRASKAGRSICALIVVILFYAQMYAIGINLSVFLRLSVDAYSGMISEENPLLSFFISTCVPVLSMIFVLISGFGFWGMWIFLIWACLGKLSILRAGDIESGNTSETEKTTRSLVCRGLQSLIVFVICGLVGILLFWFRVMKLNLYAVRTENY